MVAESDFKDLWGYSLLCGGIPHDFKGTSIIDLSKNKGNKAKCDNHGIVISSALLRMSLQV